jgi:hypothetical protein
MLATYNPEQETKQFVIMTQVCEIPLERGNRHKAMFIDLFFF